MMEASGEIKVRKTEIGVMNDSQMEGVIQKGSIGILKEGLLMMGTEEEMTITDQMNRIAGTRTTGTGTKVWMNGTVGTTMTGTGMKEDDQNRMTMNMTWRQE